MSEARGLEDQVVVVTGASGGIGAALSEVVAARGGKPVLAARREAALREVAARCGPDALVAPCDVTRRAEVERLRDAALARFGRIDVWVNNAGRGITRSVAELTDEDLDEMILVNVKSALYGMQAVLPHFRARKRGQIVNVSSMLGKIPMASARSAYSAAKAALGSLSTNLRVDLRAECPDVHVTVVYPGVVATDFGNNARHGGADSRALPLAQPVDEVAAVIADAIERPGPEVFTRPELREMLKAWATADDVSALEGRPPFQPAPLPRA